MDYDCLSPRLVAPPLSSKGHEPAAKGANEADGPFSAAGPAAEEIHACGGHDDLAVLIE
jgi:hypothetical protein